MTTLQIQLDESAAAAASQRARAEGKSVENWLADLVIQQVSLPPRHDWVAHIREASERLKGDSGGRPWTRDELYDE